MRNVVRTEAPRTLRRNADRWAQELLAAQRSGQTDHIRRAKNKYRKAEVKEALVRMYDGLCCYCECDARSGEIEHLKPISTYPESGFDWNNLHLSCGECNRAKSNQYNAEHPIIDPTDPEPVTDHLCYRFSTKGIAAWPQTSRGVTTRDHADLDRTALCEARVEIAIEAQKLYRQIDNADGEPLSDELKKEINELRNGRYGSIVKMINPNWTN